MHTLFLAIYFHNRKTTDNATEVIGSHIYIVGFLINILKMFVFKKVKKKARVEYVMFREVFRLKYSTFKY